MTLNIPKNKAFGISETTAVWSRDNGRIAFSRIIYSTVCHFDMKCPEDKLAERLEKVSRMSDEDFKYIHELNNAKEA